MSQVFRLYKEGASTYQGWNESPAFPYNSTARGTIENPDGASAKNEITSIPSPFARIDLVKAAFEEVCREASQNIKKLDGNTIFHKMVSDSLDVGEIFFNMDKFSNKIEIITCNPRKMIADLMQDGNKNHLYLADALDKYLKANAATYNFGNMQNIYLLNYKNGPDPLNIIGATSPATLFFSSANSLKYVNDIFFANNDRPFDEAFQPLYKRDTDYILAWWTLKKTIQGFSQLFPEIDEYLSLTYKAIEDPACKSRLNNVSANTLTSFDSINTKNRQQNNVVEVLGIPLLKKKSNPDVDCDFIIKSEYHISGKQPLVLPVETGNKYAQLTYVNGKWSTTYKARYFDTQQDINKRVLPHDGSMYPYLTISDFLEDTIIKVPYTLNGKNFFDGNIQDRPKKASYLLPIKPLYFKYFSHNTLTSTMSDGKPAFSMQALTNGSINVVMRIPIKGNGAIDYIEYERLYYVDRQPDISTTKNEGSVVECRFTGMVMPCVKYKTEEHALYTIACITQFSSILKLEFYHHGEILTDIPMDCRYKEKIDGADYKAETYTIIGKSFDFIRICDNSGAQSILLPQFSVHQNLDIYQFAIDLGTSNTHIEYKKSQSKTPSTLEYNETENVCGTFFIPSDNVLASETDILAKDFIPSAIGKNQDYGFPARTALSCAKTIDWREKQRDYGLLNFNFAYNKLTNSAYNAEPYVNIKWNSKPEAQSVMQAYIKNVMMLIRNKILANNGDLEKTQITWFNPNSMSPKRLSTLRDAWDDAFRELFNPNGSTNNLSESIAPIRYYFYRYATATNLINVDIGGGTTDIAFSTNGKVDYITSFRFAVNNLFEDSFSEINPCNGIIDSFKNDIFKVLQDLPGELKAIYRENDGKPAEMASFLFSLKDNNFAKEKLASNAIDFDYILRNDSKFKIVFVVFYTAIIYHIAQIIKAKDLDLPRHIAFTGNGSKIINVISTDSKHISLLTKYILESVTNKKFGVQPLDILGLDRDANPKEVTCKGGLLNTEQDLCLPQKIVLKDSFGTMVCEKDTYGMLTDKEQQNILESVNSFFNFTLNKMPSDVKLSDYMNIDDDSLDIARQVCKEDLKTYLEKGIKLSVEESGDEKNVIEDALSFYPIKGFIQALSSRLQEHYNQNNRL